MKNLNFLLRPFVLVMVCQLSFLSNLALASETQEADTLQVDTDKNALLFDWMKGYVPNRVVFHKVLPLIGTMCVGLILGSLEYTAPISASCIKPLVAGLPIYQWYDNVLEARMIPLAYQTMILGWFLSNRFMLWSLAFPPSGMTRRTLAMRWGELFEKSAFLTGIAILVDRKETILEILRSVWGPQLIEVQDKVD